MSTDDPRGGKGTEGRVTGSSGQERSAQLTFLAWYSIVSGVAALGTSLYYGARVLLGMPPARELGTQPAVMLAVVTILGLLWLRGGADLLQQRRRGGLLVLTALVICLGSVLRSWPPDVGRLVLPLLGAALVLSTWSELERQ